MNEYTTKVLSEAALLIVRGFPLARIEPDPEDPSRKLFVFDASISVGGLDARATGKTFYTGTQVDAREYSRALADLKAAVYPRILRPRSDPAQR